MNTNDFDLFLTLIKLKSYLISLIDEPESCFKNFNLTIEYLDRRSPERKDQILELLKENNINSDCDIVFDEKVHEKFRIISYNSANQVNLQTLLSNLEIETKDISIRNYLKPAREEKLKEVIKVLFSLAKIWNSRKEIEEDVDDYSILQEEDALRPDEEIKLLNLDKVTSMSFESISLLTKKYLELLIDYYFSYGGDVNLRKFLKDINGIKNLVDKKYSDLFSHYGLGNGWLEKFSDRSDENL